MASSTKIYSRFKGVKNSSLISKPSRIEEVWDAIFETRYKMPRCPDCKEILVFDCMEITHNLNVYHSFSSRLPSFNRGPEEIHIHLYCSKCPLSMECMAAGLNWDSNDNSISVEEMEPISIGKKIRP